MWDVLSFDWDQSVSEEQCFRNVSENMQAGSIVVFHDSLKAEKNLRYTLQEVLKLITRNNWNARSL